MAMASYLLDGVGAIFASRSRSQKEHGRSRYRESYDQDSYRPPSSRRPRRNTNDSASHYRPSPGPVHAPDVDHLREARAQYYQRPPEQRLHHPAALSSHPPTPPAVPDMEPRITRVSSTRKHSRSKRHDEDRHQDDRRPSRKEREDRDSAVYVYSTPRSGESRSRREDDVADTRSRAGTSHRRATSSPAANVIDVEIEKEPAPSVRRDDSLRMSRTMSGRDTARPVITRPSLRRTGTIKSAAPEAPSATPQQNNSRRNSGGIFGLFRNMPPPAAAAEAKYDCMVCMDEVRASRCPKLSCGHRMCNSCLKRQFELSVKDPQHMPPRCCTNDHIPLKYVDRLFDTRFKILWNKKYQEYTAKNRVYCPTRGCGEWIKPSNMRMDNSVGRKYGKCPRCRNKVCVKCNGRWHMRKDCPKDEEMQRFAEMAKESGWQRCYNCKAMVELKEGCNHMTCRCTAQFCMLCGLKWKTCECPWFNYAHLDDDDRLQGMRVPEPYVVVERGVAAPPPPQPADHYAVPAPRRNHPIYAPAPAPAPANEQQHHRQPSHSIRDTYADREREDELLARRLQSQFLADAAGGVGNGGSIRGGGGSGMSRAGSLRHHHAHHHRYRPPPSRRSSPEIEIEVLDVGNAAAHHMNDFGAPAAPAAPTRSGSLSRWRSIRSRRAAAGTTEAQGYGGGGGATAAPQQPQQQQPRAAPSASYAYTQAAAARRVEASVMAGLGDPARSGMGRVGMWLNYVENDPAEVEGRAQRVAAAAF